MPIVLKSGSLNLLEPSGPVQACNGIAKQKLPVDLCYLIRFTLHLFFLQHFLLYHKLRATRILYFINFSACGAVTQRGSWPPRSLCFQITHNDTPQSVGLLWTSDQRVAKTSTWQHTTLTTDKHPCPRWDSNPRS